MFSAKNNYLIIITILLAIGAVFFFFRLNQLSNQPEVRTAQLRSGQDITQTPTKTNQLILGDTTFNLEIADTPATRAQGLSGRTELKTNEGMLFIFPREDYYRFWMKEMNFALDLIWLDQNLIIVDITANLQPDTYPQTVTSDQPAQYVLEITAGHAEQFGIKIGDQAILSR